MTSNDNDNVDMNRVHKMVTQLMAVPPKDATQGEVILAFGKAVALMAYMIGHYSSGNYHSDDVLEDIINYIEESYSNQTVVIGEYTEN